MSSRAGAAWLVLLGAATFAVARTEWQMSAALAYEDNLFRYSATDLDAFRYRTSPARFPVRTSDDVDATIGLGFGWRYRLVERGGLLSVRTRFHGYMSNPEKSYGLLTARVSQGLVRSGRGFLSYTFMPDYLIRAFRNPLSTDTGDYRACSFSEHIVSAGYRQRVGSLGLEPRYSYEVDVYTVPFDYYDTRAHRLGAEAGWEPLSSLGLGLEYEYKLTSAKGPVPDISYRQHRGELRVKTRPRKLSRFSLEAGFSMARRAFTTANPGEVDPGHAGRVDLFEGISVEARYQLSGVALVAGYDYEWREVTSPYSATIDDVKDYRAGRLGIGVSISSVKERS